MGHHPPPPHTPAVGEQERGHARSKQADQAGHIFRLFIAESVKMGRKCQKFLEKERKEAKRNNNESQEDSSEDEEKSEKVKQLTHCHCPKFVVTDGMMAAMASGQPSQKYKAEVKEKKEKLEMEKILQNERFKNAAPKFKSDMKTELKRFRRAIQKQALEKGQLSQHQVGYFSSQFHIFKFGVLVR